jgi:hypothetical protein
VRFFKNPWVRLVLLLLVVAALCYSPTREFLKVTGMLGVPAVLLAGFMHKQTRYSPKWAIAVLCLIVLGGGYVYALINLPDRIEVRKIMASGSVLVQRGEYESAIAEYSKLEKLGKTEKMRAKMEEVEREKKAQRDLELAQQMIDKGDYEEARRLIKAIPPKTRAAREASALLASIPEQSR